MTIDELKAEALRLKRVAYVLLGVPAGSGAPDDYQFSYRVLADVADYLISHLHDLLGEDPSGADPAPEST